MFGPLLSIAVGLMPQVEEPDSVPPIPELALEDLELWRERIQPKFSERSYEAIPWIPSFSEGVRRADAEEKPLLFWAMNGHPLGCT